MSITRQLLNEFRPLFRMFDEPFARSPAAFTRSPFFDEAFVGFPRFSRPAVDVREEGNSYIVEADLPGVQKENIEVSIGDGGRSITIEGKIVTRSPPQAEAQTAEGGKPVAKTEANSSSERFVGNSTFTRTVWLPQAVETTNVSAELKDGVLTLSIPKTEGKGTVKIPVH
ncbi:HSP20-like chaperone [Hymenopellis radicata]|nr:HSP20-like chaperone [Hymenopellis radicata]